MPEVRELPPSRDVIAQIVDPFENVGQDPSLFDFRDLKKVLRVGRERQRRSYKSKEEKAVFEDAYRVLFGILSLEQDLGQLHDPEAKERSARLHQAIVHYLVQAEDPSSSFEFADKMLRSMVTLEWFGKFGPTGSENINIRQAYAGILGEKALVDVMKKGGLPAFIPDYSQDLTQIDSSMNYIRNIDMDGTDVYTVIEKGRNRVAVCLDAQSNVQAQRVEFENVKTGNVFITPLFEEILRELGVTHVARATVIIPTRDLKLGVKRGDLPAPSIINPWSAILRMGNLDHGEVGFSTNSIVLLRTINRIAESAIE